MGRDATQQRAYNKAYYQQNKERLRVANHARYMANREEILAKDKARRQKNAEKISKRNRSEEGRAKWRRYEENNREKRSAAAAARRARNPGAAYAATRRYIARHPEVKKHWDTVRYARHKGATGTHTRAEWEEKKDAHQQRCGYCGQQKKLLKDHDVPLARGGSNNITNIIPACARCNSQKRALTGNEYREQFHGPRG